ncbi:rap guanine nucleotide exchange factor 6-like isoform X2 [Limulus polyphemus]|uniref:Rap guanine nucleotide exchange factor 6-like isoform X2 n=1 Tax=Limulus polyphemus TaxID=6850 RepID=A0ABM1T574_LIMPO|nr:rap guanine nucleotide exchange factor 6-like isoform X2 [Limulus polyphemus]
MGLVVVDVELQIVYSYLHGIEALSSLRKASLQALCKSVRYEQHNGNNILYCRGELSTCWYVLLSGCVFIDGSMFLPRSSFGKRSVEGGRRVSECIILESSEMIAVSLFNMYVCVYEACVKLDLCFYPWLITNSAPYTQTNYVTFYHFL